MRLVVAFLLSLLPALAWGQGSVLQAGPPTGGHVPMYTPGGSYQAVIQDSGPASGGLPGLGLGELLQVNPSSSPNTGTGPFGAHICDYSAPINSGAYYYLCFDSNAQGGGLLAYGNAGTAPAEPLVCIINGVETPCFGTINGLAVVANNAALKLLPVGTYSTIYRAGFYTPGDGGGGYYNFSGTACSIGAGAGDDGSQVKPTTGTGCWLLAPQGALTDLRVWGATPAPIVSGVPSGATDVMPYIQKAYNSGLGCIFISPGFWFVNSGFSTSGGVAPCFQGSGWNEAVSTAAPTSLNTALNTGTWLYRSSTATTPFTITGVTGQGGTPGFSRIAFFDVQPAATGTWTPTAYPYWFIANANLGRLDWTDLHFYNTTGCISMTASARQHMNRISGQPTGTCLYFDQETDVLYVQDIDFWGFWSGTNTSVATYAQANVDPIVFGRADSPFVSRVFGWGYHSTLAFIQTASGVTTGPQFSDISGDATKWVIWIEPGTNNVQLGFSQLRTAGSGETGGNLAGSEGYRDDGAGALVDIGNFDCFYAGSNCVDMHGAGRVAIGNGQFWNYNQDNNSSVAMNAGTAGFISLANNASVINPAHGGLVIPAVSAGGTYAIPSVRQAWTPVLFGSTAPGTFTYSFNTGTFWYNGSQVTFTFNISVATQSGATGNMEISTPFAADTATEQNTWCFIGNMAGVTLGSSYSVLSGSIPGGVDATAIQLLETGTGLPTIQAPVTVFNGGTGAFVIQGQCVMNSGQ
jgi:hypothetical protein